MKSNDMPKSIVCPNCGATNEHDGKCDYCGAPLVVSQPVSEEAEKKSKARSKKQSQKASTVEGIRKVNVDKLLLEQSYDPFSNTTTTKLKVLCNEEGLLIYSPELASMEFSLVHKYSRTKEEALDCCEMNGYFKVLSTGRDNYNSQKDKNLSGKYSLLLDKATLKSVCQAKEISFLKAGVNKKDYALVDKENVVILIARLFYHTFYDNSSYTEAADQLYEFTLAYNSRFDERIFDDYFYYRSEKYKEESINRHLKNLITEYNDDDGERNIRIDDCEIFYYNGHCELYMEVGDSLIVNDSEVIKEERLSQADLLKLCEAQKISRKNGPELNTEGISLMAQVFYRGYYDTTKYPEAADRWYKLCMDIKKAEKEKRFAQDLKKKQEQEAYLKKLQKEEQEKAKLKKEQRREEEREEKKNEFVGKIKGVFHFLVGCYVLLLILSLVLVFIFPDSEWSMRLLYWMIAPFKWLRDWIVDMFKGIFS